MTIAPIPEEVRGKARILVVEDNLLNQKLDAFLLSQWGLSFDICDNAVSALSRLKEEQYSLVLMDIRLPAINGLEAAGIIRNDLGLNVPVIGITAYPTDDEKQRCLQAGMNSYLSKPVDEGELFSAINSFLTPIEKLQETTGEELG